MLLEALHSFFLNSTVTVISNSFGTHYTCGSRLKHMKEFGNMSLHTVALHVQRWLLLTMFPIWYTCGSTLARMIEFRHSIKVCTAKRTAQVHLIHTSTAEQMTATDEQRINLVVEADLTRVGFAELIEFLQCA